MKFSFSGKIVRGTPTLSHGGALNILPMPSAIEFIKNSLRNYKLQDVVCTITDDTEPWSVQANNLFEGLVRKWLLSGDVDYWEDFGMCPSTFDELRMYCKIVFLGCKYRQLFGGKQWEVQSITQIGKKQMTQGIDALMNHMILKGIDIDQEKTDFGGMK